MRIYSGYKITFDGKCEWSFGNKYARNVTIFRDNSSSSHADNLKNNFQCQLKGTLLDVIEALMHQQKGLVLILVKQTQNVA